MYVVVEHEIKDPEAAFSRGERLIQGDGAPPGVRVLQFLPSRDRSAVSCLWEADSVEAVREYVDSTLGEASENACFEVDADLAFSARPHGLQEAAPIGA